MSQTQTTASPEAATTLPPGRLEMRRFSAFHGAFVLACLPLAALPASQRGFGILTLVVLYNLAFPVVARLAGYDDWWRRWCFLAPLSALQVLPDGFLTTVLGVLEFPSPGVPKLFGVSVFMAGMWTIPLMIVTTIGDWVARLRSLAVARWVVAMVSLLLFVGSEAVLWRLPIWRAVGVTTLGHVALYVVLPEVVLGLATFEVGRRVSKASVPTRLLAAAAVMILYLGCLGVSFLFIEGAPSTGG